MLGIATTGGAALARGGGGGEVTAEAVALILAAASAMVISAATRWAWPEYTASRRAADSATVMSQTTLETITSEVATVGGRSAATTIALVVLQLQQLLCTAGKWSSERSTS